MTDYKIRIIDCKIYHFSSSGSLCSEKNVLMYTDYICNNFNTEAIQHNIDDINTLSILHYNDKFYIFQAGGYNPEDGLFTEMIDLSQYNINR